MPKLDSLELENSWRSQCAYRKISKKPNNFTPCARKDAFNQYVKSLEKNTLFLLAEDIANFQEWHFAEYSKQCTFVYIFLDKEKSKHTTLYVGKTKNLKTRMTQHASKDWYKYANCLAIEPYENNTMASEREAELIYDLTPLFNKQGGLGMSFQKTKDDINIQVPKMGDVSNLKFAPIGESIAKYKLKYGAVTKDEQQEVITSNKNLRSKAFHERHLAQILKQNLPSLDYLTKIYDLEGA